jgi:hypothetical protein
MRNRTSSGVALKRMLQIIALMETLFPDPVDPATRRWGILPRSTAKGSPAISFPTPKEIFDLKALKLSESMISLR